MCYLMYGTCLTQPIYMIYPNYIKFNGTIVTVVNAFTV